MTSKAQAICHHFLSTSNDIVCLLDTHLDEETEDKLSKSWPGQVHFAHSNSSSHTGGIAILTRNLDTSSFKFKSDPNGRYAFLRLQNQDQSVLIASVYAPAISSSIRSSFFKHLIAKCSNLRRKMTKLFSLEILIVLRNPPSTNLLKQAETPPLNSFEI